MIHTAHSLQAAFGYLFEEEIHALGDLVQGLPEHAEVLQIGAGAGTSSLAILEARADVHLTTIDIENNDSPFGSLFSERQVVSEAGHIDRLSQWHGDSKSIAEWLNLPLFDMIFIDGDHSYEGCAGDINGWMPHLNTGGIMAIHDYGKAHAYEDLNGEKAPHPKALKGVDWAVDEFLLGQFEKVLHTRSLIAFRV